MVSIKAQIETMGLLIIVVIIVLVFLFVLAFMRSSDVEDNNDFYSLKANNLMNAIKKVSVCNENMEDAIKACCDGYDFCGEDACDFVEENINIIIGSSIEENYYFEAKKDENVCISLGNCEFGVSSSAFFMPRGYEMSLKICEK
jgi:hypothetical protein